ELPLAHADMIVALDFKRVVSFARLLRRTGTRIVDGKTVCNGNRETVRTALARDSILIWHFRSFHSKRRRIRNWVAEPPVAEVVSLATPRDAEGWLRALALAHPI
ncbi:MAG: adenylate kinase, partial [Acidimicrobiales bacterium]